MENTDKSAAPDYSRGVPRSVVEERIRAKAAASVTMCWGSESHVCSLCDNVADVGFAGSRCNVRDCPGVFVPIVEGEAKCKTCGGSGEVVVEWSGTVHGPPDENGDPTPTGARYQQPAPCPECAPERLPRDFELERVEPSTGGARERLDMLLDHLYEAAPDERIDEEQLQARSQLEDDLRALLAELDEAKAALAEEREQHEFLIDQTTWRCDCCNERLTKGLDTEGDSWEPRFTLGCGGDSMILCEGCHRETVRLIEKPFRAELERERARSERLLCAVAEATKDGEKECWCDTCDSHGVTLACAHLALIVEAAAPSDPHPNPGDPQ